MPMQFQEASIDWVMRNRKLFQSISKLSNKSGLCSNKYKTKNPKSRARSKYWFRKQTSSIQTSKSVKYQFFVRIWITTRTSTKHHSPLQSRSSCLPRKVPLKYSILQHGGLLCARLASNCFYFDRILQPERVILLCVGGRKYCQTLFLLKWKKF